MDEEIKRELSYYRLESAEEHLRSSKLLLDNGLFRDSVGRSYYALFTATRAVLALDEKDFSKHSGVISYFQKEYIRTRRFDVKYSDYLTEAFRARNHADYDDYYMVSKDEAVEQYQRAVEFCEAVKAFLDENA